VELLNAAIAIFGVAVTILVAWSSTRSTRARRRAEEARLALELLKSAESVGGDSTEGQRSTRVRLQDTARFATTEFTRLMLDDGPRWWSILPAGAYGAMLIVATAFGPNAVGNSILFIVGAGFLIGAVTAIWVKRRRSRRLMDAGVHVASITELLERERQDWTEVWKKRRAARTRRRSSHD